jgi:hypothetical protein
MAAFIYLFQRKQMKETKFPLFWKLDVEMKIEPSFKVSVILFHGLQVQYWHFYAYHVCYQLSVQIIGSIEHISISL